MLVTKYNPKYFNPSSIEEAKKIILTDETIPDQWESETKWTMDFFHEKNLFNEESIVLDWGCGVGRLSKKIIEEYNCKVVGVDFQPNMLKYAREYVNHQNFTAINGEEFFELPDNYFTTGIAVWALQHTVDMTPIITCIQKKLKFRSKFCVLESNVKSFPVQHVEPHTVTRDDIVFNVVAYESDNFTDPWVSSSDNASIDELMDRFSVEELTPLTSEVDNLTLSTYFDYAWIGIFVNDKKYFYY
jgi:ubiquinone/menaquinone biosynthesis C-methylase UbiE